MLLKNKKSTLFEKVQKYGKKAEKSLSEKLIDRKKIEKKNISKIIKEKVESTLELDKKPEQIVEDIEKKYIKNISSYDEIIGACRKEMINRAASVFLINRFFLNSIYSEIGAMNSNSALQDKYAMLNVKTLISHSLRKVVRKTATSTLKYAITSPVKLVGIITIESTKLIFNEFSNIFYSNASIFKNFNEYIKERKNKVKDIFYNNIKQLNIIEYAKNIGIENAIEEFIKVIPIALIEIFTKLPKFMIQIMKTSLSNIYRCARVLASEIADKINVLIVIVKDTVFHVVDSSINSIICTAIAPIPLINMFKEKISFVMSGVFSTLLTLTVIYKLKNNDENNVLLNVN